MKTRGKDAQIEALKVQNQATQQTATTTEAKVSTVDSAMQQNSAAVNSLQASVTDLREKDVTVASSIQQVQQSQEKIQKSLDEPVALHYKGILITPGGFIAGESIYGARGQ
jgi:hypothetical protein